MYTLIVKGEGDKSMEIEFERQSQLEEAMSTVAELIRLEGFDSAMRRVFKTAAKVAAATV